MERLEGWRERLVGRKVDDLGLRRFAGANQAPVGWYREEARGTNFSEKRVGMNLAITHGGEEARWSNFREKGPGLGVPALARFPVGDGQQAAAVRAKGMGGARNQGSKRPQLLRVPDLEAACLPVPADDQEALTVGAED